MATITYTDEGTGLTFLRSVDVKVFPCSYRGYYYNSSPDDPDLTQIFDPEARGFTEYNYSNIYSKLGDAKKSFVISWDADEGLLKCVINGYYFELSNIDAELFRGDRKLIISTLKIDLGVTTDNHRYSTWILNTLYSPVTDYLDTKLDNNFFFVGLAIADKSYNENFSAELTPFKTIQVEGEGGVLIEKVIIDWAQRRVTDTLDNGTGISSVNMMGDISTKELDTCSATGDYSTALGRRTTASGIYSVAFGQNTIASASSSLAIGNASESKHENAIATGDHTKTSRGNQIVIGQYNTDDNKALVIIAGSGSDGNEANNVTIHHNGDIWTTGELSVDGGLIKATTKTTNTLQLGGSGTNNSGAIDVYGKSDDKVFTVSNTGKTYIEDVTEINNYVDIKNKKYKGTGKKPGLTVQGQIKAEKGEDNTLTLGSTADGDYGALYIYGDTNSQVFAITKAGAVSAASTLTAGGNTTLNGTLTVAGETQLNNNLTVASSKTTTLGGTLTVAGATQLNNTLTVAADKATTLSGTLTVSKATTLNDTLTVANGKSTTLGGILSVSGTSTFTGAITASSSLGLSGNLTVGGATTINNSLNVANATTLNSTLTVANATTLNDNLTVADGKSTTLGGSLTVKGGTTLQDALTVSDDKNTILGGTLQVKQGATFDSTVGITGALTLSAGLSAVGITGTGDWSTSGTMTAASYSASSDKRLKENIKEFEYKKSILDLPVYKFDFINGPKEQIGCLAQDLQEFYPELVHETENGFLAIQESKLVYLLLEEVKKLKAEIKHIKEN